MIKPEIKLETLFTNKTPIRISKKNKRKFSDDIETLNILHINSNAKTTSSYPSWGGGTTMRFLESICREGLYFQMNFGSTTEVFIFDEKNPQKVQLYRKGNHRSFFKNYSLSKLLPDLYYFQISFFSNCRNYSYGSIIECFLRDWHLQTQLSISIANNNDNRTGSALYLGTSFNGVKSKKH